MAILKNVGLKTSTIDEIKDNFDGAQGVVVVNYSGLTVEHYPSRTLLYPKTVSCFIPPLVQLQSYPSGS